MASSININQNNNDITLQDNNRSILITDNNAGTTVSVSQPVTSVITVAAIGPQGPVGPIGPIPTSGSFTGSFSGSFIGNLTGTASNATSASFASTASYVQNAQTASYVTTAQTASYVLQAVSASYALTASYLEGYISPFPYSGSAVITGSLTVSGSSTFTNIGPAIFSGSITQTASTASFGGLVGIGTTTPIAALDIRGTQIATGSIARIMFVSSSLSASANNDILVGFDINPSFNVGAFTGVTNYAARISGTTNLLGTLSITSGIYGGGFNFTMTSTNTLSATSNNIGEWLRVGGGNIIQIIGQAFISTQRGNTFGNTIGGTAVTLQNIPAQSSGTSDLNALLVNWTLNNTGTYLGTARGIYYNPTLTSLTGTTHRAIETVSGNVIFNSTSGNTLIGTTTDAGSKLLVRGSGTTSSTTALLVQNSNASSSLAVLDNGNVGIGTATPTNALSIGGNGAINFISSGNISTPASFGFTLSSGNVNISHNNSGLTLQNSFWFGGGANVYDNVGVSQGTTNPATNGSAVFQISSTRYGFLPPRTNLTSNISTPARGLITYLTGSTNEGLYYYNSGSYQGWTRVLNNTGSQEISGSLAITANLTLSQSSFTNQNTSSLASGTQTISTNATGSFTSAFYNYTISSGSNARAGQVMSVWNGGSIQFTDVTTADIGSTTTVALTASLSGANVILSSTLPSLGWTVKTVVNLI